ncbi:MAG TPA: hypothetical protein VN764_04840, partial [Polyangiaceae bacterium]|nr:hypothetical protein [Polyangiaceae bacterium]
LYNAELNETGNNEFPGTACTKLLFDKAKEFLKQTVNRLLVEVRRICELGDDLCFGQSLACHEFSPEKVVFSSPSSTSDLGHPKSREARRVVIKVISAFQEQSEV